MKDFYIPKTMYHNICAIAKEKNKSITSVITGYLKQAIHDNITWRPGEFAIPDKINNIPAVHFTSEFTAPRIRDIIAEHKLDNSQILNALAYGLNKERR